MLRALVTFFGILVVLAALGAGGVVYVFHEFGRGLPDYRQLADYEPPVTTRVHAGDGRLLAEYATEKRVFVPIAVMPKRIVNAVLSAEDKNFFSHPGIDLFGVARAIVANLRNLGKGRRLEGASTITQQVAKNFLLSNEVSFDRKIKEAILAFRIERALGKDRILELYLNEIYFGFSSYGVAAAALNYFNKSLGELSIAEAGFLAGLPKAPNNYDPRKHPRAAKARRDWVIGRMEIDGVISPKEAEQSRNTLLYVRSRSETEFIKADYFAEEVRRELATRYGEDQLYEGGLSVRTPIDPRLQEISDRVLRQGLETYDRRHGWRGPVARIEADLGWRDKLERVEPPPGTLERPLAVVLGMDEAVAEIGFADGRRGRIPLAEMKWARPWMKKQNLGPRVRRPADVLVSGDVVIVEAVTASGAGEDAKPYPEGTFALRQLPEIDGGLVVLDPHTGRVLAMSGGHDYRKSQFNRVTQAMRQPGSAFKPFVYLAALDYGFSPSTQILDAPFVVDQGPGLPKWRPDNYAKKFYGHSTMRVGIEKSRNLMTVRLAQAIGMEKVAEYAERFAIVDVLPQRLSMALGAGETTLLRLTTAYAMLVNGGKRIRPTLIDRIQDRHGKTVFRHDARVCPECAATFWTGQAVPVVPDSRPEVASPASAYQVVSFLQGVVERGTGMRVNAVGKPLGGKTGTTNESFDTWFVGFSPDLAVGVFVGFDAPRSLGRHETGSSVAAPIFRDFMAAALSGKPAIPFRIPPGIRLVRVNSASGELAEPGERGVILEAFKPGTEPVRQGQVLQGIAVGRGTPAPGTGRLY